MSSAEQGYEAGSTSEAGSTGNANGTGKVGGTTAPNCSSPSRSSRNGSYGVWLRLLRDVPPLLLLVCFIVCVFWSRHWPLVHDASIIQYAVFLMDHGMAPYRDIIDINMPGAYMIQWGIMHVFGGGSTAWRCFDILTMLVAIGAACWIALPYDWRAGATGGLALALFHLSFGAVQAGERDWFLMVLLLLGYAFLFHALRTQRPWLMGLFALAMGAAATIKPLAIPFPFLLLLLSWFVLRRRHVAFGPYLRYALLGASVPTLAALLFLWKWHVYGVFFTMARGLLSYYAGIGNPPVIDLIHLAFGRFLWTVTVCGVLASVLVKNRKHYEINLLGLGIAFGAFLYFGQRKGWIYHKLTLIAFLLVWVSIQFYLALRQKGAARLVGGLGLVALCLGSSVLWARAVPAAHYDESTMFALQHDLDGLGGPALSGQVQCLEMGLGCITELYRMRLVQSTGFIADFFITGERVPALTELKTRFLSEVHARPPRVIILIASDWGMDHIGYIQLEDWPELRSFLAQNYTLYKDKRLPDGSLDHQSYRIYLKD